MQCGIKFTPLLLITFEAVHELFLKSDTVRWKNSIKNLKNVQLRVLDVNLNFQIAENFPENLQCALFLSLR